MSIKIILAGHGHFATGLGSALELIMGMPEHLQCIDFPAEDHIVHLEEKFDEALMAAEGSEIIVLVDLFSGSPFNVAMKKAQKNPHVHLFYGVNLGMLMEIVSRSTYANDYEKIMETIVPTAREQIGEFLPSDLPQDTNEEEDDEL